MKIQEIYDQYQIMPNLQEHMLRVAGVASIISNNFKLKIDKKSIITACLIHDIGKVVEINLDTTFKMFPYLLIKKNHWIEVQKETKKKYGTREEKVRNRIFNELKVSDATINIVNKTSIPSLQSIHQNYDYSLKVFAYSDMRVSPDGISPLNKRFKEGVARNLNTLLKKGFKPNEESSLIKYANKIEEQIFAHCIIKPEEITEEKVRPLIESLRNYEIETGK